LNRAAALFRSSILAMKKSSPRKSSAQKEKKSEADKRIGGQPENDQDARAAGLKSATAGTPRKDR
jgi:hypothetical protein